MEKEVMEFVDETWTKASSILDTYVLPLDIEAKIIVLRTAVEDLSSAINDDLADAVSDKL